MDRRIFAARLAAATLGAAALGDDLSFAKGSADTGSKAPYQLSVMLWTVFRDLPIEQRLENIAVAGYTNVELVGEYYKWSEADYKKVAAKCQERGIKFDATAGLRHGICNPKEREAWLADLREALDIMERIQCPAMIVLTGDVVPGMPREEQHRSCIDALKAGAALVEGKKIDGRPVRLLLENIDPEENPKYYLTSVLEGFEIVKAVNHPQVQFLYDFFHEQISGGNLIAKLEKNMQHLGLVHVADVPGRHEPGTGEINYHSIYRKLTELQYKGIVAMEFMPTTDPIGKLKAAREMALRGGQV